MMNLKQSTEPHMAEEEGGKCNSDKAQNVKNREQICAKDGGCMQNNTQQIDDNTQNPLEQFSTSEYYKNAGNRLCSSHRYEEAINYYVKAIEKSPEIAIYYSNKALCHLKLQQWTQAVQDCRCALELDPNLLKAHYFIGQALTEMEKYDESLKHLQKAHELARERKLNFGDDITSQIRSAKRRRWNKIEREQEKLEEELENYLVNLINQDRANQTHSEPTTSDDVRSAKESKQSDLYISKLRDIFSELKMRRNQREVPDYLCGKISFEIMRDPVITPCGITYDRHDIEEHLRKVGHFDPITRQALAVDKLIPNLAMKEVVDAYLNENEWAHHY